MDNSLSDSSVMGFSRHEYWSGLLCPPPVDLLDPGIQPMSLMSPALEGGFVIASTKSVRQQFFCYLNQPNIINLLKYI